MSKTKTDIVIAGVGGQGSLTASKLLGEAAMNAGFKVVGAEIHGMAQRGGVVTSTIRIGNVWGPIVSESSADLILGFEPVETLRTMNLATESAYVVTNTRSIVPANVSMKGEHYPETKDVLEQIRPLCGRLFPVDASEIAKNAGNVMAANSVLLGVVGALGVLPFESQWIREAIEAGVPERVREVNLKAFELGLEFAAEFLQSRPDVVG